ncbi:phage terminase small subunit [Arthrobacter sp. TMN-37]
MPGPKANPTKPNSRHRGTGARSGLIELPAGGCELKIPSLPKMREWSKEERSLWRNLWKSPQANEWDDSYIAAVAAYICHAVAVYAGTASAWQAQEMRHLGGQLGLTPAGMLALGWVVRHEQ